MNNFTGIGRLTKDVEVTTTQNNKKVAKFTIAINKYRDGADFLNCVAWEKTAEVLERYTQKGSQIGIVGRVETRNYEDKTGNRVYITEIIVNQVELLGSKSENKQESYSKQDDSYVLDISNDDLPF